MHLTTGLALSVHVKSKQTNNTGVVIQIGPRRREPPAFSKNRSGVMPVIQWPCIRPTLRKITRDFTPELEESLAVDVVLTQEVVDGDGREAGQHGGQEQRYREDPQTKLSLLITCLEKKYNLEHVLVPLE